MVLEGREFEDLAGCLAGDWMSDSAELLLLRVACLAGVVGAVSGGRLDWEEVF